MKYIVLFCLFIFIFSINLNAAIQHLTDNALPKSTKNCGNYVANVFLIDKTMHMNFGQMRY